MLPKLLTKTKDAFFFCANLEFKLLVHFYLDAGNFLELISSSFISIECWPCLGFIWIRKTFTANIKAKITLHRAKFF